LDSPTSQQVGLSGLTSRGDQVCLSRPLFCIHLGLIDHSHFNQTIADDLQQDIPRCTGSRTQLSPGRYSMNPKQK